jgi:hypothetical protein
MPILFSVTYISLWIVVLVQLIAIFALYHHFGQMYLSSPEGRVNQGPKVESKLKSLAVRSLEDQPLVLPAVQSDSLLVFASTDCPLCDRLRPDLIGFAKDHPTVQTIVICSGSRNEVREWAAYLSDEVRVVPDPAHRVAIHYDVRNLPFCVGTDEGGIVRIGGVVNTRRGLEEALEVVQKMSGRDGGRAIEAGELIGVN